MELWKKHYIKYSINLYMLNRKYKSGLTIMSGRGIFTFVSIISVLLALLRSIYKQNQ